MIARKHRFHGHNSLRFVYQHGTVVRDPLCSLKYAQNPRRSNYRLAVVVSKKTAKSAVVRNRIRRRLYEQCRTRLPSDIPYDLVLTVFSDKLATMPVVDVEQLVTKLITQSRIVQNTKS